jgi:hypothetical protein
VIHGALSTGLVTMVQEALVSELLEQLLSGSGDEQASAAQTVCELCCERRGYTQARRCRAPGTAAPGCTRSEALPENTRPLCLPWAERQHRGNAPPAKPSIGLTCWQLQQGRLVSADQACRRLQRRAWWGRWSASLSGRGSARPPARAPCASSPRLTASGQQCGARPGAARVALTSCCRLLDESTRLSTTHCAPMPVWHWLVTLPALPCCSDAPVPRRWCRCQRAAPESLPVLPILAFRAP